MCVGVHTGKAFPPKLNVWQRGVTGNDFEIEVFAAAAGGGGLCVCLFCGGALAATDDLPIVAATLPVATGGAGMGLAMRSWSGGCSRGRESLASGLCAVRRGSSKRIAAIDLPACFGPGPWRR